MGIVRSSVVACIVVLAACLAMAQEPHRAAGPLVIVLELDGVVGPGTADYLRDGFAEAARRKAELAVVRIDTPGGLASSMRDIVMAVLASPVPIAAYVAPAGARAASAGTYIVYASHLAAMAPSTHLGAATPVTLGGGFTPPDQDKKDGAPARNASESKAVNDAVASIRGLADLRGRDAGFAERAVREAATLTATEARAQGVVEIVARDLQDLLRQADGRTVRVQDRQVTLALGNAELLEVAPDWRAKLLSVITNPNIAYLLLLAGIYGLLFELLSPGAVFPGVVGAIALLVGLYALNLLPISYAGAGLLLAGMAMMLAEAFVPSFGALGIGGIIAFVIGSFFLFPAEVPGFRLSLPVIAVAAAASAAFLVIAMAAAFRAHRRSVVTGEGALLGSPAQVLRWADKEGEVHVHGERWRAISTRPLASGQRVRVVGRRDLTLLVEPDAPTDAPP